jgi:hypothetical protein
VAAGFGWGAYRYSFMTTSRGNPVASGRARVAMVPWYAIILLAAA